MAQGIRSFKRRNNNSYDTYYLGAYPQLIEMASSFDLEEEFKIGGNKEVVISDFWPSPKNKTIMFPPSTASGAASTYYHYSNLVNDYPAGFGSGGTVHEYDDPIYKKYAAGIIDLNLSDQQETTLYIYNSNLNNWQEWEQVPFEIVETYYDNTNQHNVTHTVKMTISSAQENYLVDDNSQVIYTVQDLQDKGISVNVEDATDFQFDNGHNIEITLYKGIEQASNIIHIKTIYIRMMQTEGVQLIKEVIS